MDTSTSGGTTAFSTATDTAQITVTPVNDAPVLSGDLSATVNEGATYIITATDLGYTDPDDVDAGITFTTSSASNGKIQVNGSDASSFTGTQLSAGQVTFVHDGSETLTASFDVNVEDGNEESSVPVDSTFNFTVTPVNDAPVLSGDLSATVNEGATYIITGTDLGYTDPDDVDAGITFTTSSASNGKIQVNGSDASSFTGTQLSAGQVTFVHDGSETLTASFDVNVEDGNEESSVPVDSTFNFTVTPVDDAPRFTGAPDGNVITESATYDTAKAIAVQADGKSVVGGYSWTGTEYDFMVARYNSDGTLDTTFGGGDGIAFTGVVSQNESFADMTLQADGKILLTGYSDDGSDKDFKLTRLNADGTLDLDFGTAGSVTTDFDADNDYARAVAVHSDGKIVIAGVGDISGNRDVAVVRYNSDGTLDTTFDVDGKVTTDVGLNNTSTSDMTIQADGKIVVFGSGQPGFDPKDFFTLRYNTDGSLDSSWGGTGIVITSLGANSSTSSSVAVQADGKIIASGLYYNGTDSDVTVLRYDTNGILDNTFGVNGVSINNFTSNSIYIDDMALQADGKIVLAGYSKQWQQ